MKNVLVYLFICMIGSSAFAHEVSTISKADAPIEMSCSISSVTAKGVSSEVALVKRWNPDDGKIYYTASIESEMVTQIVDVYPGLNFSTAQIHGGASGLAAVETRFSGYGPIEISFRDGQAPITITRLKCK